MRLCELLEVLGSEVEIKLFDRDNVHVMDFKRENESEFEFIKENHFARFIKEVDIKDNKVIVRLKNFSLVEQKAIEEMIELKVHSRWDFLQSVFFKLDSSDMKEKERIKQEVLTPQCTRNVKYISKNFNNGYGGAHIIVLNNGEWFEIYKVVWGSEWYIFDHSRDKEKEHFMKYLR